MEIHDRGQGKVGPAKVDRIAEVIDLTRPNRERIAEVVHEVEEQRVEEARDARTPAEAAEASTRRARLGHPAGADVDRVEVSAASHALSTGAEPAELARRSEHVARVRAEIAQGTLASTERVERAAEKLLSF